MNWTRLCCLFSITFILFSLSSAQSNCTKCNDGSSCCGTTHCCPYDDGGSMCCTADEDCCIGVCCISQTTFCCKAQNGHPDRCCPRWSLCCPSGTFGCCTPLGVPWTPSMGYDWPNLDAPIKEEPELATVVHSLFVEGSDLHSVTIDVSSGTIVNDIKVPNFNNHGEITRPFAYDEKREVFYYVETDFSTDPESNLTLTTVDPTSGKVTRVSITGTNNAFPTGYSYHCKSDQIYVATQPFDNRSTASYTFYTVNVSTARATQISVSSVAGTGLYSGWFHTISDDGTIAYRLGYGDVPNAANPGLGITKISTSTASTTWQTSLPLPSGHNFYVTGSIHQIPNTNNFLSLAPKTTAGHHLDLVQWNYQTNTASVLASLGDDTGVNFGPIGEVLSCDGKTYASILYLPGNLPVQDKWQFSLVDVTSGKVTQEIIAKILGETSTPSGLGIPLSTQYALRNM